MLNGLRHYFGTFFYSNGSKYIGNWKDNLKDGKGVIVNSSGDVSLVEFQSDKIVQQVFL